MAGDGVQHATWTPPHPGDFTFTFPSQFGTDVWQARVLPAYSISETSFAWHPLVGRNLNLGYDEHTSVSLPFPVRMGGTNFSTVDVDSNGKLNFLVDGADPNPVPLPNPAEEYAFIFAPWWDKHEPFKGSIQNVWVGTSGAAPNREFLVEWYAVSRAGCDDPNSTITFEAVFKEGSPDLLVNYANTSYGGTPACTAGDSGQQGEVAIQVRAPAATVFEYKQPSLQDNMALVFSPVPNPVSAAAADKPY